MRNVVERQTEARVIEDFKCHPTNCTATLSSVGRSRRVLVKEGTWVAYTVTATSPGRLGRCRAGRAGLCTGSGQAGGGVERAGGSEL